MCINLLIKYLIFSIFILLNNYCYCKNVTYKIAIVGPFTGAYSAYGKQLLIAANKAITELNQSNINLEIIPFDDQCNHDLAKSIANKIILNPEIKAVIGHACQTATLAASKIYAKQGMLHLIPTACSSKITEQHTATVFRLCGSDDIEAQYISDFIYKNFKNKKIAILHSQQLYNHELITQLQEHLATLKIFPTLYQSIKLEQLNNHGKITTIIKKLQKLNIDIIFFGGFYKEAAQLIKIMNKNQIKIPIITSSSIATKGFIEILGSNKIAAGTMMSFPKLDAVKLTTNNLDLSIFGYAAIQIIRSALQNNTNKNPRILANWLHQNKVNTVLGEKSWDTNGNIINDAFAMYMWDANGNYSLIN